MNIPEIHFPIQILQKAIDNAITGIVIADMLLPDQPLIYINQAFERMTGYQKEEILGKNCRFLQGRDTEPQTIEVIRTAIKKETNCVITLLNYKKNGDVFWNELTLSPIFNEQKQLTHYIGVQHDVTKAKEAELIAKEKKYLVNAIINTSLDAIVNIDEQSCILEWNKQAEIIFGWTKAEVIGKPLDEFIVPPEYRKAHNRGMQKFLETGEGPVLGQRIEITAINKKGIEFPIELSISPIKTKDTYIFSAYLRDISYRRKVENETQALLNKLEESIKELESFSYSVSHDLRAPLRHISGYADLLRKNSSEQLDERGQRFLATIIASSKRMGELIDDLLVFSRMGRVEMRNSSFNTMDIISNVQATLEMELANRNIKWRIGDLPTVKGDAKMLEQVFFNLLSNAVKYTKKREKAIIEIDYEETEKEYIFWVKDNGAGFDMRYQHKLFGIFQRLHHTDEFEGTGIGLANVKRIINRHQGKVWGESELNKGANFYFTLPK